MPNPAAPRRPSWSWWNLFTALLPYAVLIFILGIMGVRDGIRVFQGSDPRFFTLGNFSTLARECAPVIVAAAGMTLVIVSGGIDLSVGSIMAISAGVAGYTANLTHSAVAGLSLGVFAGLICGMYNGVLIVALRVPPFIATLGTLMALRGLVEIITDHSSIFVGDGMNRTERDHLSAAFQWLSKSELPHTGIPTPLLVAILVVFIFWVMLNRMRIGRRIYAVGSNEAAARLSGVRILWTKWLVYAISGLTAGLAGTLIVARVGGPAANMGTGQELLVISAVVIGGASLSGGQGTIGGCVIGAVLMSALSGACTSFGISDALQKIVIGHFLIGAVAVDQFRRARLNAE